MEVDRPLRDRRAEAVRAWTRFVEHGDAASPAIRPEISGRAWITGVDQHMLDPADPWPQGYRLSDTWGAR